MGLLLRECNAQSTDCCLETGSPRLLLVICFSACVSVLLTDALNPPVEQSDLSVSEGNGEVPMLLINPFQTVSMEYDMVADENPALCFPFQTHVLSKKRNSCIF